MAQIKHSGGIVDVVLELGFDAVKYFEVTVNGTAQALSISPPGRRLTLRNTSTTDDLYFNVVGGVATTLVSFVPGDNLKLGPGCVFEFDFDTLTNISLITGGADVLAEGYLGWKGTVSC